MNRASARCHGAVAASRPSIPHSDELAADTGSADVPGASQQITARLDIASTAREGQKLELWFDPHRMHLLNPETGAHLTLQRGSRPVGSASLAR